MNDDEIQDYELEFDDEGDAQDFAAELRAQPTVRNVEVKTESFDDRSRSGGIVEAFIISFAAGVTLDVMKLAADRFSMRFRKGG